MAVTGTVGPPLMLTETALSPPKPVVWPAQYRSACFGVPVKLTSIVPGWLKIVPAPPVAIPVPVASVTPTGAPSVSVPSASAPDEQRGPQPLRAQRTQSISSFVPPSRFEIGRTPQQSGGRTGNRRAVARWVPQAERLERPG